MHAWKDLGWKTYGVRLGPLLLKVEWVDGGAYKATLGELTCKARWTDLDSAKGGAVRFAAKILANASKAAAMLAAEVS